ncbi:MAG: response regulator [Bacteroidota bacterium]
MKNTRILIVEDELLIAMDIKMRLTAMGYQVVGTAQNQAQAWEILATEQADLAVVDIELKGKIAGISLAKQIKESLNIPVIFLTSHTDALTVAQARAAKPASYVLKPFNDQSLHIAIDLAIHNHETAGTEALLSGQLEASAGQPFFLQESIFVRKRERFCRVKYKDILYLEAQSNYSTIFTRKEKYTLAITLGQVGTKLSHPAFVRVSRSFIVNMHQIDAVEGNAIYIDGKIIKVSKVQKMAVFQHFNMI